MSRHYFRRVLRCGRGAAIATAIACGSGLGIGCDEDRCLAATLARVTDPHVAVLTSDYSSTSLSVLAADGALLTEAFIDSGTTVTGINAALSGDVVFPSLAASASNITLIDRLGVDVLTRISVSEGKVLGQLPAHAAPAASRGAYRANPQDVVEVASDRYWVSRFEPNLTPAPHPLDLGNDLLEVEVSSGAALSRIDLSSLDATVAGTTYFARPSRMVRLGVDVVVGLGRLDRSFMQTGPGAVAIVHVESRAVSSIDLSPLANCGELTSIGRGGEAVIVLCAGPTFRDSDQARRIGAGFAVIERRATGLAATSVIHLADHPDLPVPSTGLAWVSERLVASVAPGSRSTGAADRLVLFDLAGPSATVIAEGPPFEFGAPAFDAGQAVLLLPAGAAGLRRFRVDGGQVASELDPVAVSPCRGLPARQVVVLNVED